MKKVTHRIETLKLDDDAYTPLKALGDNIDWTPALDDDKCDENIMEPKSSSTVCSPCVLFTFVAFAVFCVTMCSLWRVNLQSTEWFSDMADHIEAINWTRVGLFDKQEQVHPLDPIDLMTALEEDAVDEASDPPSDPPSSLFSDLFVSIVSTTVSLCTLALFCLFHHNTPAPPSSHYWQNKILVRKYFNQWKNSIPPKMSPLTVCQSKSIYLHYCIILTHHVS
jgi:hypothetical protein